MNSELACETVVSQVDRLIEYGFLSVTEALLHSGCHQLMGVGRRDAATKRTGMYLQRPIN